MNRGDDPDMATAPRHVADAEPGGAAGREVLVQALDLVGEGVIVADGARRIVLRNESARQMLARGDDVDAEVVREIERFLHDGAPGESRRFRLADGRELTARRVGLGGASALVLDDNARVVPTGSSLLREVLDTIDASLVVYDSANRYVFGNEAYHRRYPHLPDDAELAGKTLEQLLRFTLSRRVFTEAQSIHDPEGFIARRLAEYRRAPDAESERLAPEGRWDLMRSRTTKSGMRVTMRVDITEQKRMQEDLMRRLERLESDQAVRATLIAKLSHELRTPVSLVIGYADLLRREIAEPQGGADTAGAFAERIHAAGEHLLDLLNNVLDMSRAEAGGLALSEEPVDMVALMRSTLTLVEPAARDKGISLAFRLPGAPVGLRGDQRMLRQMVLNLLSNAVRFTDQGAVTVLLERDGEGGLRCLVQDTGIGMPGDVLARLGEPFYQGPNPQPGGVGLGLAVVKELIALHGGRLEVQSTPGEGTQAALCFPADRTLPATR